MPRFRYRAADLMGHHTSGELTAANDIDLDLRLRRMGLMLVRARPARRSGLLPGQHVSRRDLISFCFLIQQIARTGAPLLEGLRDLVAGAESTRFRDLLTLVVDDLESGRLLSEALAAHPDVFDRVFIALVRAAEQSDQLEIVFARLETRLKQQDELQAELGRMLIYPALTAIAVLAAAGVMLFYLTPRLATLIHSLNLPMPFATRMLIGIADLAREHLLWLLALASLGALGVYLGRRYFPGFNTRLDDFWLRLPVFGPALKKNILARVFGLLALLLQSGVGLLEALAAGADSAGNRVIARKIGLASQQIAAGGGVSQSLRGQELLPPLVLRMLHTGESNGALPEALENVAWFYQRDAREAIDRSLKFLEPGLAALLGLLLALLLLAVFLPVYQIIGELPL
jgi:type IV pilus assembly protein PilC